MARTLPKSDPKIEVPREELRQEVAVVRRDDAAEAVNARLEGRDAACARNDASAEEDGRKSPPASHRMSPTLIVSWEEAGLLGALALARLLAGVLPLDDMLLPMGSAASGP